MNAFHVSSASFPCRRVSFVECDGTRWTYVTFLVSLHHLHYLRHKPVGLILIYLSVELILFQYCKLYCRQNVVFLGTFSLLIVTIKRHAFAFAFHSYD